MSVASDANGPTVLTLRLDGFEPDRGSLTQFAKHLMGSDITDKIMVGMLIRAAETMERAFGCTAWSATVVELGLRLPDALFSLQRPIEALEMEGRMDEAGDVRDALTTLLGAFLEKGPVTLEVADTSTLPVALAQWLSDLDLPNLDLSLNSSAEPQPVDLPKEQLLADMVGSLALCGAPAPADLLARFHGVDDTEIDAVLDRFEDWASTQEAVTDYEYRHPSFPENPAYGLAPGAAETVLAPWSEAHRASAAADLCAGLKGHLDLRSRGSAVVLSRLGAHSFETDSALVSQRMLAWWVGRQEADEGAEVVARALDSGEVHVRQLWDVIEAAFFGWPSFRLTLLLDAFGERMDELDAVERADYHIRKAQLHRRDRRLDKSHDEAVKATDELRKSETAPAARIALAYSLAARAAQDLSNSEVAEAHLKSAVQALEEKGQGKIVELADIHRNLADLYKAKGEAKTAAGHQGLAVEILESAYGPDAPQLVDALRILGMLERQAGALESSLLCLERTLDLDRSQLPEDHPQLAETLKVLADTRHETGDLVGALQAQKEATEIDRKTLGDTHERMGAGYKVLANWSFEADDYEGARGYLHQALKVEEAQGLARLDEVAEIHEALSVIAGRLSDDSAKARHLEAAEAARG